MVDLCRPLKIENPSEGGTQTDPFPTETDPAIDYLNAKGVAFEAAGTALIQGASGVLKFQDTVTSPVTLSQILSPAASVVSVANSGTSFNATNVQGALVELRKHPVFDQDTTATTNNGTLTMTASNSSFQYLIGTGTPFTVVLPSALTLFVGNYYQLFNNTPNQIQINDFSGGLIVILSQNSLLQTSLVTNGTAAGFWVYSQTIVNTATGIISYNAISSVGFSANGSADTAVTGFSLTPQAGTYGVWVSIEAIGTGSGASLDILIYKAGAAVVDSKRTSATPAGTHVFSISTQSIIQFNGSQICAGYINANGSSYTIAQRSLLLVRLGS